MTVGSGSPATEVYDASGDPKTLANGNTQSFNAAGQLTGTTAGGSAEAYGYNATGDRASSSGSIGSPATYSYNQLDQLAGAMVLVGYGVLPVQRRRPHGRADQLGDDRDRHLGHLLGPGTTLV